jgi:glutaminase
VRRGGDFHAYAVDTPVLSYSYFYERLLDWTLERINYQPDQDPFEEVSQLLATANYPSQALICVGAPRYSDFGESTFLEKGDEVIVAVYDGAQYKPSEISEALKAGQSLTQGVSLLAQTVD